MPATWTVSTVALARDEARGVAGMVRVTAVSGARVIKTSLRAADVASWEAEKAWRS